MNNLAVVAHPRGDAAEVLEREHVPLEERFFGLRTERDVKRPGPEFDSRITNIQHFVQTPPMVA